MLHKGANGCGNVSNTEGERGRFNYPTNIMGIQDSFAPDDVGLSHPNNGSFIKINGQGEVVIHANGMSIHMSTTHRRITVHASDVKILAKSIFWNKAMFDPNSFSFTHPLLQPTDYRYRAVLQNVSKQIVGSSNG